MTLYLNKASSLLHYVYKPNHIHIRATHNTPSYRSIKRYSVHPELSDALIRTSHFSKMFMYPRTVENILKLESTFQKQKLVPMVHATPSCLTPAIMLATALAIAANKQPPQKSIKEFAVLRAPGDYEGPYEEAMKITEVLNDQGCVLWYDHAPQMRLRVISMNYGLITNLAAGESAIDFGFIHFARPGIRQVTESMIIKTLLHYGFSHKEALEILLSPLLDSLIKNFDKLHTGNFLVFGLSPDFVERFVYDSFPFGEPTEAHPLQVIQGTQGQNRYTEHQARMLITQETLDPRSPMTVVSAVDQKAVDTYVSKYSVEPFVPPFEFEEFRDILPQKSTTIENRDMKKRQALIEETERFCQSIVKRLHPDPIVINCEPQKSQNLRLDFAIF